jgi:diacylglycerol kinase (ATP)
VLSRIASALEDAGTHARALPTSGPGTASDLARKCIAEGADLILVAGGDGTVNEVANGMVFSDVPLGLLPAGTANVLAMELGLGRRAAKAAQAMPDWVPVRISIGALLNEGDGRRRYFLLMAGVGLDAHIVYQIDATLKNAIGKVAYWITSFGQIGRRLPAFEVDVDGERYRCSFALASRVRNYGGDLEIAQGVSLIDHHFELVMFEGATTFPYLKYFAGVLTRRLDRMRGVTILQAKAMRFSAPTDNRIYVQVDGECAGTLPSSLAIVPRALTLLVPPTYRSREPAVLREHVWTPSPSA